MEMQDGPDDELHEKVRARLVDNLPVVEVDDDFTADGDDHWSFRVFFLILEFRFVIYYIVLALILLWFWLGLKH